MLNMLRNRISRDEKGFTLIELLVVVIILGILTAIAVPSYLSFRGKASDSAAESNVRAVIPAVEGFYSKFDTYAGMTGSDATTNLNSIDASIDLTKYLITGTATTYCVQYPAAVPTVTSGSHTYYKNGPNAPIAEATSGAHC
jgi:type IV pilus assembly protein PilA